MTETTLAEVASEDNAKSQRKSTPGSGKRRCSNLGGDKLSRLWEKGGKPRWGG